MPLRVAIVRVTPCGIEPWRWILPKRLICAASRTGLVKVPSEAKPLLMEAWSMPEPLLPVAI